jgi:hypothetical protein
MRCVGMLLLVGTSWLIAPLAYAGPDSVMCQNCKTNCLSLKNQCAEGCCTAAGGIFQIGGACNNRRTDSGKQYGDCITDCTEKHGKCNNDTCKGPCS